MDGIRDRMLLPSSRAMSDPLGKAERLGAEGRLEASSAAAAISVSTKVCSQTIGAPSRASRAAFQEVRQRQIRQRLPAGEMIPIS